MKLLSSEITFQSILLPLKKIANYLDYSILTVFLPVKNSFIDEYPTTYVR